MEKRFLLAFVLSLLVLVLSQVLIEKKFKQTARPTQPPASSSQSTPATNPQPPPTPAETKTAGVSTVSSPIKAEREHDIVLENSLVKVILSNRGGIVKSWILKQYKDSNRQVLDLVAGGDPAKEGMPLSLYFPDNNDLSNQVNSALFADTGKEPNDAAAQKKTGVVLQYSENGIEVEKSLSLKPNSFLAELDIQASKAGTNLPCLVEWPARFGDNALETRDDAREVVTLTEGRPTKTSLAKVKDIQELAGGFKVGGVEDRYFVAIFLPATPISRVQVRQTGARLALPPEIGRLYVGPKEIGLLKGVDPQLESLVDFGWFGIIGKPLFFALRWIYGYCKNYGLAVILLTIVINMAIFPLRWKSMVSAQKMQKLQPKIKAIQERYKKYKVNDPKKQEMNQEMMALYKEHGVNPLGGCLPILLQMPILIAFYNVLTVAIDLRQVSFLWIPDLSQYDKTFVLVIIMVVTQFLMQKLTPTPSADPAQAKLFMLMPLVFGFMFAKVASGLVLYWLTGNVIGIIQQLYLNKHGMATAPAAIKK
ncbi:MAG: membrane protein insertase YidC [Acidobacteriia bacterium]|nr:membrane protein insertase YidC [Terriglobia bacterium]